MKKLLLTSALALSAAAGYAQCQAGFTATANPVNNNLLQEQFLNTSTFPTGGITSYHTVNIQYGDGQTGYGIGSSINHTYSSPGTYNVVLTTAYYADSLNNTLTCSDSSIQQITVGYPCAGTIITGNLNGNTFSYQITSPGNTAMTYSINFGDGSVGVALSGNHIYTAPGTYTMIVTSSGNGCVYANTYTIFIPTALGCSGNNASFTSTNVGSFGASFTNTSTTGTGSLSSAVYSYGDGSSDATGMHTYAAAGNYTVVLTDTWVDSGTNNVTCIDTSVGFVTITGNPITQGTLSGYIIVDSSVVTAGQPDSMQVYLIQYDANSNTLSAVASQTFYGPYAGYYQFANVPSGTYMVKVAPHYASANVGLGGMVPTYGDSSLYWATSHQISLVNTNSSTNNNVYMQFGTITSGPGFISGNVSLGANKNTNTGVPHLLIFLRDANSNLVSSAYTDNNGDFSFGNLPYGTYDVYPENMNYTTTSLSGIVLDANNASMTDATFYQDNAQHNIKPHSTGIHNTMLPANAVVLFPNPAKGNVTLTWSDVRLNNATVSISNVAGQVVYTGTLGTTASKVVNVTGLKGGVYFVRLTGNGVTTNKKLVIE